MKIQTSQILTSFWLLWISILQTNSSSNFISKSTKPRESRWKILPHKVKMQYVHFRIHTNYFLLPWKITEEISRQSVLFNNSKAVPTIIKHMSIQPFTMGVDWSEIVCQMAVSVMFHICTYYVFALYDRIRILYFY